MPRLESFFRTLPQFHHLHNNYIKQLYGVRIIHDILNKFSWFFLPIYLFTQGSTTDVLSFLSLTPLQSGMVMIALFFGVLRGVVLLSAIPVGAVLSRWKIHTAFITAYVLRVGVFFALYFSLTNPIFLIVAAVLEGLYSNIFWNSFFTVLSRTISSKFEGRELGMFHFFGQLIAVLSPATSGYLVFQYGFEVLFLIGVVLSLLSAIFVVNIQGKLTNDTVSWQEFNSWLRAPAFLKATGSFVGRYFNDVLLFLWPLYLYLFIGGVDRVGFIYTFSLFIALVVAFFLGGYVDRVKNNNRSFYTSGGALSLLWLARTQLFTIWGFAVVDAVERLFSNFHWLFYDVLFIHQGKGKQAFSYFVYREMVISIVGIIFWLAFCVWFLITDTWTGLFIFGGFGVLLSLLISKNYEENSPASGRI